MNHTRAKRWLSLLAVVSVAAMIFFFSAQEGDDSSRLSAGVTEWVLTAVVPGYARFNRHRKFLYLLRAGFMVRKAAHFSEYALLGLTLSVHLHYVLTGRLRRVALAAWGIATLYAVTDEFHQMFVAGRGPAAMDVLIDSAGALTGAFIGIGLIALWHRHQSRKKTAGAL